MNKKIITRHSHEYVPHKSNVFVCMQKTPHTARAYYTKNTHIMCKTHTYIWLYPFYMYVFVNVLDKNTPSKMKSPYTLTYF